MQSSKTSTLHYILLFFSFSYLVHLTNTLFFSLQVSIMTTDITMVKLQIVSMQKKIFYLHSKREYWIQYKFVSFFRSAFIYFNYKGLHCQFHFRTLFVNSGRIGITFKIRTHASLLVRHVPARISIRPVSPSLAFCHVAHKLRMNLK